MSVKIEFKFPAELSRNSTIRTALVNTATFVRDMWLARSPYATGEYAKGLTQSGSIKVEQGRMIIENKSRHAAIVEYGFRSFNLGLAMLNSGKGVKVSADGNRYKVIKIEPKERAAFRSQGVANQVQKSFASIMPIGMPRPQISKYGGLKTYQTRRPLLRPLKGKKPSTSGPRGIFVISEKAIKENPMKWQMPARAGMNLSKTVSEECRPYVIEAIKGAVQAEADRQMRAKGQQPAWNKGKIKNNPISQIPRAKANR